MNWICNSGYCLRPLHYWWNSFKWCFNNAVESFAWLIWWRFLLPTCPDFSLYKIIPSWAKSRTKQIINEAFFLLYYSCRVKTNLTENMNWKTKYSKSYCQMDLSIRFILFRVAGQNLLLQKHRSIWWMFLDCGLMLECREAYTKKQD